MDTTRTTSPSLAWGRGCHLVDMSAHTVAVHSHCEHRKYSTRAVSTSILVQCPSGGSLCSACVGHVCVRRTHATFRNSRSAVSWDSPAAGCSMPSARVRHRIITFPTPNRRAWTRSPLYLRGSRSVVQVAPGAYENGFTARCRHARRTQGQRTSAYVS